MAFSIIDPQAGFLPIASIDSGVTTAGGTVIPTPPLQVGQIVKAVDPTFGIGEFILLPGVTSCAVGSVVTYNTVSFTTTLSAVGGNIPQPIAIAMAANTSSSTWSWYQVSGVAVVKKQCTVSLAAGAAVGVLSTGLIAGTGSGKEIDGAVVAAVASATAGRTSVRVMLQRPTKQGRVT
jgi:hypothetical protein